MDQKKLEKIKAQFGAKVKAIRLERDITQLDLAAKMGVDIRQIQRIENAEVNSSITTLYLLSIALEVGVEKFFEF